MQWVAALQPASADDTDRSCPAAGLPAPVAGDLPRLRARLAAGETVRILALGSSSTSGAGASEDRMAYPAQLAMELIRLHPGHTIEVVNAGAPGEDVRSMVGRLERALAVHRPDLVVWQVGTNALLRHVDIAVFRSDLRRGIEMARRAGADVILMDLQYAPRVLNEASFGQMLAALEDIARRNRVPLFRRFALMRDWAQEMGPAYSTMLSADGLHMNDRSYACLAARLAESIFLVTSRSDAGPPKSAGGTARGLP